MCLKKKIFTGKCSSYMYSSNQTFKDLLLSLIRPLVNCLYLCTTYALKILYNLPYQLTCIMIMIIYQVYVLQY